jgi:hypothetical protein
MVSGKCFAIFKKRRTEADVVLSGQEPTLEVQEEVTVLPSRQEGADV